MCHNQFDSESDVWSEWLLCRRFADDPEFERLVRAKAEYYSDRVLVGARLSPGMTLADIGSGEGLIAFRAIDRIGPSLRVFLTDISAPLLRHAEMLSIERGVRQQCTFLQCSAEKLADIPDNSVDVVTTRAVLAWVSDKRTALQEFHRILKPGGRVSIGEPILRDEALEAIALRKAVDAQPPESQDHILSLLHRWRAAQLQFPDTEEQMAQNPITNYSERDLVQFAQDAGFAEIHMEFHIDIFPSIVTSWEVFLDMSPHPWSPSVGAILASQFTSEERCLFEQVLRPKIERRQLAATERIAYLTAAKPPA